MLLDLVFGVVADLRQHHRVLRPTPELGPGLSTGGSLSGSLRCQTSAAKSWRRSVMRNKNRTPVVIRLRLEVQLETPDLVGRCRIGRAFEPSSEPLATVDIAALRERSVERRPCSLRRALVGIGRDRP